MGYGDGLSNKERLEQATQPTRLEVVNDSMASLLRRIESAASKIRYYGFDNLPDGSFDRLLPDLKRIRAEYEAGRDLVPDGEMDPAQALLLTFTRQLSRIADRFNDRWAALPKWYLDQMLHVDPLPVIPERTWAVFRKDTPGTLRLGKGSVFTTKAKSGDIWRYQLAEQMQVSDIEVARIVSVHYAPGRNGIPGRVEVADVQHPGSEGKSTPSSAGERGFLLTSPMLILREGCRKVVLELNTELQPETPGSDFAEHMVSGDELRPQTPGKIFDLRISTAGGWTPIGEYALRRRERVIEICFVLDDRFPATVGCTGGMHGFESAFPALKAVLNTEGECPAGLELEHCLLKRISLRISVSETTLLSVYNEIGQVDPSRPFAPFGLTAEQGAWLVVGSYEMAVKPVSSVDLHLHWSGLPDDAEGLAGYYKDYKARIDNDSFRLEASYLSAFKWQSDPDQKPLFLFASTPPGPGGRPYARGTLATESILKNIRIRRMPPVTEEESAYGYDRPVRSGFIRLTLTDPKMGFGEKQYQYLYMDSLVRHLFKKQVPPYFNPPLQPVVERITMDYRAEQEIDFTTATGEEQDGTGFFHLYPLGCRQCMPDEGDAVPLLYAPDAEDNLLVGLQNVSGSNALRLYFDLKMLREDIIPDAMPDVAWHIGDGYRWQALPDGVLAGDMTRSLLTGGCVDFLFPKTIPAGNYDSEGILWLRAGVRHGREFLSRIRGVYANPAELIRIPDTNSSFRSPGFREQSRILHPEREIAGLSEAVHIAVSAFERPAEDTLHCRTRVADYVSHRGRAVTARDFERIVLREFPGITKVKCLPDGGRVRVAVIPRYTPIRARGWYPLASASQLLKIKELLDNRSSIRTGIEVVNPRYEEIVVRCEVTFRSSGNSADCRSRLKALCDEIIAPWRENHSAPQFGHTLNPAAFTARLHTEEYVAEVREFSLVRVSQTRGGRYEVREFSGSKDVAPSVAWGVFVPAEEHMFNHAELPFGIDEMVVDDTFVVGGSISDTAISPS